MGSLWRRHRDVICSDVKTHWVAAPGSDVLPPGVIKENHKKKQKIHNFPIDSVHFMAKG